ncbi:hypothetical protein BDW67DRAFT_177056 [Aspergillus spinulosporus]
MSRKLTSIGSTRWISNLKERLETPDDVFGELTEHSPNFRNVGFFGIVILMMKTQIGLGVLAIPSALDVLGMVPGIICMMVVACITTWSSYIIGSFKLNHREMYIIDDAGAIMFGLPGRVVLSSAFCLYYISSSGSAILGLVAAVLGLALSSVRTLGRITWLAWIGLPCILAAAVIIVSIAVGVQDRPATAPRRDVVSNLLFTFSGTPGFFSIVSEMRDPRHYGVAVLACQAGVMAVYMIIGCVIYYYCGLYISSPALGSAGGVIKIISFAFALPGLLVTMTIVTHIPAKFIFVHLACTFGITLIAWIIASTIHVFNALVSLIGALLGPLMRIQPMAAMWQYDNWGQRKEGMSVRWMAVASYSANGGSAAFWCADNSNSV